MFEPSGKATPRSNLSSPKYVVTQRRTISTAQRWRLLFNGAYGSSGDHNTYVTTPATSPTTPDYPSARHGRFRHHNTITNQSQTMLTYQGCRRTTHILCTVQFTVHATQQTWQLKIMLCNTCTKVHGALIPNIRTMPMTLSFLPLKNGNAMQHLNHAGKHAGTANSQLLWHNCKLTSQVSTTGDTTTVAHCFESCPAHTFYK